MVQASEVEGSLSLMVSSVGKEEEKESTNFLYWQLNSTQLTIEITPGPQAYSSIFTSLSWPA